MQHPQNVATILVLRFLGTLGRDRLDRIPEEALRQLRNSIRDAIGAAVEHERKACARVAEADPDGARIGKAIRSRRTAPSSPVWRREDSPVLS
jgi:hypothetical protein